MEIKGVVTHVLDTVKGESAKGAWEKTDFVIQTEGDYPKSICFTDFNNKANAKSLAEGQTVTVSFNAESREYQGKYYTNLTAWRIATEGEAPKPAASQAGEPPF